MIRKTFFFFTLFSACSFCLAQPIQPTLKLFGDFALPTPIAFSCTETPAPVKSKLCSASTDRNEIVVFTRELAPDESTPTSKRFALAASLAELLRKNPGPIAFKTTIETPDTLGYDFGIKAERITHAKILLRSNFISYISISSIGDPLISRPQMEALIESFR